MRALRVVLFSAAALVAIPLRAADWPGKLGPHGNNVTTEIIAPWTSPPEVVWRQTVGHGFSMPIVADGKVFVHATVVDGEAESVTAYDLTTGSQIWRDVYDRATYDSQLGDGPRSTPVYDAGRLYTYGVNGKLSCYESATGKRLWQTNPFDEFKAPLPQFGVSTAPTVIGDRLIVAVGGDGSTIVAYDTATGKVAWRKFDEPPASGSAVVRTFGSTDAPQTEVILQTSLRLLGLNPRDGEIHWEHPLVFQPTGVSVSPLLIGDRLIVSSQDIGTLTLRLPGEKGKQPEVQDWRQDVGGYFSPGSTDGERRVYLVTNVLMPLPRSDLVCLDVTTNKELWSKSNLGYFHLGVTVTGDGKLFLLDDSGNAILAKGTGDKFEELCRAKVCGGTLVHPATAAGLVLVRDDKEVVCLKFNAAAKNAESSE